jgi:hypothetical protein
MDFVKCMGRSIIIGSKTSIICDGVTVVGNDKGMWILGPIYDLLDSIR